MGIWKNKIAFYKEHIQIGFAIGNDISHKVTSFKNEGLKDLIGKFIDNVKRFRKVAADHVREKYLKTDDLASYL